jgi:hypothetical protein
MPWYPNAERRDITTGEFWERGQHKPLAIVDHITDGNDSLNFLQNIANDSSVHFLIGRRGQVYQFIDTDRAAWANGICDFNRLSDASPAWLKQWCQDNSSVRACGSDTRVINRPGSVNMVTISIEHEARISERLGGFNGFTDSQIAASIELHKWLIATHSTLRPDRDHIIGHYQIDCIERAFCPGGRNGEKFPFQKIINALGGGGRTDPLLDEPMRGPIDLHPDAIARVIGDKNGDTDAGGAVAEALCHFTQMYGLSTSKVAGQVLLETNYLRFGGDVLPSQHNFAGFKTASGVGFHTFQSVDEGIEAVCQHHLAYILGQRENWPQHVRSRAVVDPRLDAVLALFAARVKLLSDYGDGIWAEDPQYAVKIAGIARLLRHTQGAHDWPSLYFPETRRFVGGGFKAFYEQLGERGLQVLGFPLTTEQDPVGLAPDFKRVQCFERGVLAWNEVQHYPWDVICLPLPDAHRLYEHFEQQGMF